MNSAGPVLNSLSSLGLTGHDRLVIRHPYHNFIRPRNRPSHPSEITPCRVAASSPLIPTSARGASPAASRPSRAQPPDFPRAGRSAATLGGPFPAAVTDRNRYGDGYPNPKSLTQQHCNGCNGCTDSIYPPHTRDGTKHSTRICVISPYKCWKPILLPLHPIHQ